MATKFNNSSSNNGNNSSASNQGKDFSDDSNKSSEESNNKDDEDESGDNEDDDNEDVEDKEEKLDPRLKALEDKLISQINGVSKKLEMAIAKALNPSKNASKETKEKNLNTVEALKEEFESKQSDMAEKLRIAEERINDRDAKAFKSDLKSTALALFTRPGKKGEEVDDVSEAYETFISRYGASNFSLGDDDSTILFTDSSGNTKTLDKLVSDWRETKTGKRFNKAKLNNGTGKDQGKEPQGQSQESSNHQNRKRPSLSEIKEAAKEGNLKIRI